MNEQTRRAIQVILLKGEKKKKEGKKEMVALYYNQKNSISVHLFMAFSLP